MTPYARTFPGRHAVLPVIHVESEEQALRNARLARVAGCDGAFLINHGIDTDTLLRAHAGVVEALPDWWLGVNCLGVPPAEVFARFSARVAGVWIDDAGIDEATDAQPAAERIAAARHASGWPGLYFGGVAFKYQRPVGDHALVARRAAAYVDVVTTSGPATGQAAARAKIAQVREGAGTAPVAIASGITPDNVHEYLDLADCFLVATGISASFAELDPQKVSALVATVRAWRP